MYSSIELDVIEMYGMTSAELEKLIKTKGEVEALRYFEYQTSEAFRLGDHEKALQLLIASDMSLT